MTKKV